MIKQYSLATDILIEHYGPTIIKQNSLTTDVLIEHSEA